MPLDRMRSSGIFACITYSYAQNVPITGAEPAGRTSPRQQKRRNTLEIARNLLANGADIILIMKSTGLSKAAVLELQDELV